MDLDKADFGKLCKFVCDTGFDIKESMQFGALECGSLTANTIKHGPGRSAQKLLAKRPDLFPKGSNPEALRVG
jgi:hypothetical protein